MTHPTTTLACPGTPDRCIKQRPYLDASRLKNLMSVMILEMDAILLVHSHFRFLSLDSTDLY